MHQESEPRNIPRFMRGHLSRDFDDFQVHQQIQIERETMKFLKKCRKFKRPPQSIRISGANVVNEVDKLKLFSKFEAELLDHQISCKIARINELVEQSKNEVVTKLSNADRKRLRKHFTKKLKFYKVLDETRWKDWPVKEFPAVETAAKKQNKKDRNYKKRQKKRSKKTKLAALNAIESGSVVVLVDENIPDGAIAVLGKGMGFIPTPKTDPLEERLQMRQTVNRVLSTSRKRCNPDFESNLMEYEQIPSKLRQPSYNLNMPTTDKHVNTLVERLVSAHNSSLTQNVKEKNFKSNLSKDEREGLNWLVEMTSKEKISVVSADKGGAILIVPPELLKKKVLEKLEDPALYTKLDSDPLLSLKKELFELWKKGKERGLVSSKIAYEIGGVTENNNMSTLPIYKPGVAYYYPLLKIHKVRKEDLVPGVEPPARLVTSLREGVAKRSDVFIADRYLKDLEKDYCTDLLVDTSDALRWLDEANRELSAARKKSVNCFTFDFKALYDSLNPDLVKEALMDAMNMSRPGWSEELKNWLLSLVDFSLRASVAKYEDSWYLQKNGVPTGGSLCVQIANITVFYVMNKKVYSQPHLMRYVIDLKRFIDDGVVFFIGTKEEFTYWLRVINSNIGLHGLVIDESNFQTPGNFVNFLDILFCFDIIGNLQTDLFIKETDSRSYLNFASAHPNHTFSGTVYAQSLRLRRIINCQDRLRIRLAELGEVFKKAGYPARMVTNITERVLGSVRDISVKQKQDNPSDQIRVISTFKADHKIVNAIKKSEDVFKTTPSFRGMEGKLFTFVKKVGPSIRSQVNSLKVQALGTRKGGMSRCNAPGCKCCKMLNKSACISVNNKKVKLAKGNCKTYCICYLAVCIICEKPYTGRTVGPLHGRVNGHRHLFKVILKKAADNSLHTLDPNNDLYTLGLHLHNEHGCVDPNDFDRHFRFAILEVVSPSNIEVKEFKWMHRLNSFQPVGINVEYPFAISGAKLMNKRFLF